MPRTPRKPKLAALLTQHGGKLFVATVAAGAMVGALGSYASSGNQPPAAPPSATPILVR